MRPPLDLRRTRSIAAKEVRHIRRDPFTLAIGLGLPFVLVVFFGWIMSLDLREIRVAFFDRDASRASRALAETFVSSGFFVRVPAPTGSTPAGMLDSQRAKVAVVVEGGFGRDLGAGRPARAQVLLDGTDNQTAGVVLGYLAGIARRAAAAVAGPPPAAGGPLRLETRFLFNPELNSRWFIVPGLFVIITAMLAVLMTALTVAREWETGSMELLLSTPVRPAEIVVGKLAPYLGLILAADILVYLTARLVLGVPFRGSHLLFAAGTVLFLVPCLAQGILISVLSRQQALAIQLGLVSSLLPSLLLSGFIFPIESMPAFFRYLSMVLPPRWFMAICRGLFLRDAGPLELAVPFAALLLLGAALTGAAIRRFKVDLEP